MVTMQNTNTPLATGTTKLTTEPMKLDILELSSLAMFLLSDWIFAAESSKLNDDQVKDKSNIDFFLNRLLAFRKPRWTTMHACKGNRTHEVLTTPFLLRRWSGVL
ncbi:hypothetical protein F2Q69_00058238 [Brassica cretica]|uniref:Uncharacterized protein n=1 Tax=Brassica cretica TaxID=69181 RepID=A0A8S9RCF2_BRACR|nr:hypothetical protein F2Q69_00058238 [Brassica cretica]